KHRQRQKGSAQYEKLGEQRQLMEVREGNARLLVDLNSYLDTGLFLDHRPVRLKLAKLCAGKRLLNLFCYTAAATVHAALGGATNSLSVDLSNTYLDWAERNFKLNQLDMRKHTLLRADVLTWLNDHREQYDVIFLDPPTFSNSKSMETVLDIQRDHGEMIDQAMRCLAKDGVLIFSTNFRKFKLDPAVAERYNVNNITDWSIPRDFQRPAKIHYCFEIKHRL
ncbi:MAG TPA: class I SAM-dependent methyltransferase, partial [Gammaproteobacteria bacterium]